MFKYPSQIASITTMNSKYSLPQAIIDAAKHGELVVFVGAGVSMLCGSPSWKHFAQKVVGTIEQAGHLSFLEAEGLRSLDSPRRILSIAMGIAHAADIPIEFSTILQPSKIPHPARGELYRLLADLRPVFVTTNYDKWLDDSPLDNDSGPTEIATSQVKMPDMPRTRKSYYL